jgi:YesN/AraC family two-component response regulator
MDIDMPYVNGVDAASMIKQEVETPIILITGNQENSMYKYNNFANVDAFMIKPIIIDEFIETVYKVLKKI